MLGLIPVLILVLAFTANAQADGFSSRIAAGLLVINQADNQNGRGYATLNALNEKPRSFNRLLPIPLIELRYTHGDNSVFLGSPVDDPVAFSLGCRRKLDKGGALSGSVFYSFFGREWQDPYLVGVPRTDTRVHSYGARMAFEDMGGTPLTVAVKGTVKALADEQLTGDLRRDGARLEVDLSWRQRFSRGWTLVPLAGYQKGEYEGDANSYHGGNLGLGANWQAGNLLVASRVSGSFASYDRTHPVFGTIRRDHGYRMSCTATLDDPFGYLNYFTTAGLVHQRTGSNIDFFESRSLVAFAAIGYQF